MKVEITVEKVMRVTKVVDVTDEELALLKNGDNPFADEMEAELDNGVSEYDFAVTDMDGRDIVPWN